MPPWSAAWPACPKSRHGSTTKLRPPSDARKPRKNERLRCGWADWGPLGHPTGVREARVREDWVGLATRVLIVDDHLAVREGLQSLLASESDFVVVCEAVDGNDGVQKALSLRPDLSVLDNSMPGKTGLEVAREL